MGGLSHGSLIFGPSCNPQHPEPSPVLVSELPLQGSSGWAEHGNGPSSSHQHPAEGKGGGRNRTDFPHPQHTSNEPLKPKKLRTILVLFCFFFKQGKGPLSVSYAYTVKHPKTSLLHLNITETQGIRASICRREMVPSMFYIHSQNWYQSIWGEFLRFSIKSIYFKAARSCFRK